LVCSPFGLLGLLGLASAGCGGGPVWLDDIAADPPTALSEVGLFSNLGELKPADNVVLYEPNWQLWSSGTDKQRLLYVPEGAVIGTGGPSWELPKGSVFAKTFALPGSAAAGALAPIETRLLFRRDERWDYATYVWNDDRSDAELLPGNWLEVPKDLQDTSGNAYAYTIPSRLDCRTCHETSQGSTGTPVLGFNELQLPESLESAAFFDAPPAVVPVVGRTDAETKAFGYFVGNCIACHNGGKGDNAAFSLYPEQAVGETVNQETEISSAEGIRVIPGDPESSVLFVTVVRAGQADYDGAFKVMPPVGITRTDPTAEAILGDWILGLPDGAGEGE